jgi:predicted transcriptional regulator
LLFVILESSIQLILKEKVMPNYKPDSADQIGLSADIVSAYVSFNSVPASGLADLIRTVHASLSKLSTATVAVPEPETLVPAVSIRKSITPEYLICLDDGKKFKSLKRHLATLGMTAGQYRQKWKLPSDYPMVAPEYASRRSEMAKKIGLGQFRKDRKSGRTPKVMTENAAP